MQNLSLNGTWKLYYREQEGLCADSLPDFSGMDAVAAEVPGNVELDLERAGIIKDIYHGNNIIAARELEFNEWWYVRQFSVGRELAESGLRLVFEGLDCIATIWVNGQVVGKAANMFIAHRFDISGAVQAGENEIIVHIRSAALESRKHLYDGCEACNQSVNWDSLPVRKAPHSYGWDIMPRLLSAGLWRYVYIEAVKKDEIVSAYYHTCFANREKAEVQLKWQFATAENRLDAFLIRLRGKCGDSIFEQAVRTFHTAGDMSVTIESPRLWWPKGYGEANLYEVTLDLIKKGVVVDSRKENIGLRTIKLDMTETNSKSAPGKFVFICNGEPIMVKGANHVPADGLHSRDKERLPQIMGLYDDLGCNMIRCWGGNVYEDHGFYDFCDSHGIMVWQDFAMACMAYPQTDCFCRMVEEEAESVMRKLRNHASLVLWAGDNEVDLISMLHYKLDPGRNRLTRDVLPRVVARCDPFRQFLASSPYCGPEVVKSGDHLTASEQHLWGGRDFYKSPYYSENNACFASEIGYHGCPGVESVRQFIDDKYLWPWKNNPQWLTHCTQPVPAHHGPQWFSYRVKLMADQIDALFGFEPENIEDFSLASQISQAEGLKYFIELFRMSKWRRSGIIWWNLIDGWPQFSDAVVDYYFTKKLAYGFIKRSQRPVCVMIKDPVDGVCEVVVCNDMLQDCEGSYKVLDADDRSIAAKGKFNITANSSKAIDRIRVDSRDKRLLLVSYSVNGGAFGNHYLLGTPPFSFGKYSGQWLDRINSLK
jgi:beta-mannosidase